MAAVARHSIYIAEMQASDLLKMRQGQVVYADLKRQLGYDPCLTSVTNSGIYFKSYELREVIREGLKGCPCEDTGAAPCGAPLPQQPATYT